MKRANHKCGLLFYITETTNGQVPVVPQTYVYIYIDVEILRHTNARREVSILGWLHGVVLKHSKMFLDRVDFSGELSILISGGDLLLAVVTTLHSYL